MWDFSWLERRWPGAGYEDPAQALDELVDRGYDAVRIDAFPHLVEYDHDATFTIRPRWNQQSWGSPARTQVRVQPALNQFIRLCAERGVAVGLSTWFQAVDEFDLNTIVSPKRHAAVWRHTLDSIAEEDLLDSILYVDLCNEWPGWAPFFRPKTDSKKKWIDADSLSWLSEAVRELRVSYPNLDYTTSYWNPLGFDDSQVGAIAAANDFLEPHIWMAHANESEFNRRVGYDFKHFESTGYENLARVGEAVYRSDPGYWREQQELFIDRFCVEARSIGLPMITTECWGVVDYKDWPLLDWNWVKESTAHGVRYASEKGLWLAIATSNHCGPQFVGMWRDRDWHQELTSVIKSAPLPLYDAETKIWDLGLPNQRGRA